MNLQTTRFGQVAIRDTDQLHFPAGLIGLEAWKEWVMLADGRNRGLGWLQSVERADLALAVVSPRRYVPDYRVRVAQRELTPLDVPEGATPQVVVVLSGDREGLTVNLKAPIVVCVESRRGRQIVAKDDHAVCHQLTAPTLLRRSA